MAFFHALSCWVYSAGVLQELQVKDSKYTDMRTPSPPNFVMSPRQDRKEVVEMLKKLAEDEKADTTKSEGPHPEGNFEEADFSKTIALTSPILDKYCGVQSIQFGGMDFKGGYKLTLDIEYSWKSNGFSFTNEFFPELAKMIDQELDLLMKMSVNSFGGETNINTQPFRRAVWYYIDDIFGYKHEGFDSRQVNLILKRPIKSFIKKVTTSPWSISKQEIIGINFSFTLSSAEIAHTSLIACEAKFHLELMYALHAIQRMMKIAQRRERERDRDCQRKNINIYICIYNSFPQRKKQYYMQERFFGKKLLNHLYIYKCMCVAVICFVCV
eukprot:TRINITY_DN3213_c0_g4_i2.p1 TRINITY_DN3213_c0_g4~~TRINITY_DN3213_c0_g4_i2.p1  ORF type:complete len:327 (+),score=57.40 TRINITY_DN3213_c0_g4_i2:182-1162(+)